MAASAKDLWEKYQNFVKTNPHSVSQIEGITRVLSYVIPGKNIMIMSVSKFVMKLGCTFSDMDAGL